MRGAMEAGWYRRIDDAPHIVRRVSGEGSFFITCSFDLRVHMPCDPGGILSPEAWNTFVPVPDPRILPG